MHQWHTVAMRDGINGTICLGAAWGSVTGAPNIGGSEGWGKLTVVTSAEASDDQQMFAAGCVEGYLTADQVADWRYNFGAVLFGEGNGSMPVPAALGQYSTACCGRPERLHCISSKKCFAMLYAMRWTFTHGCFLVCTCRRYDREPH